MVQVEFIKPEKHISQRVPKYGGLPPDIAVMRALNATKELTTGYQGWAVDDLQDLWHLFLETVKTKSANRKKIQKMFDVCHEIRGEGGTFGYPLISIVGDSLCKYLDLKHTMAGKELDVVRIHILSLKAIFRQKLAGPQSELATTVTELLQALRDKVDRETDSHYS